MPHSILRWIFLALVPLLALTVVVKVKKALGEGHALCLPAIYDLLATDIAFFVFLFCAFALILKTTGIR